jgi:hypothetical protein
MTAVKYILTFLFGGILLTSIRYAAVNLHNPILAAVLAALPTGFISIMMLQYDHIHDYTFNYLFISMCTVLTILFFFLLFKYTRINHKIIWIISMILWIIASLSVMKFLGKNRN